MVQDRAEKYLIYWYSQSGNSWVCAERAKSTLERCSANVPLCESMLKEIKKISPDESQVESQDEKKADFLILVFPVYNFDLPVVVENFIRKLISLQSQLLPKKAYAIITKGGMEANTPWNLKKILRSYNIELIDYCSLAVEDSYIPLRKWFGFALKKGLPNEKTLMKVDKFINDICCSRSRSKSKSRIPNRRIILFNPFSIFHWIGKFSKNFGPKSLLGKRSWDKEKCVNCELCIKACPVNAISITLASAESEKKFINNYDYNYDYEKCIGCCGCLNLCPTNSWTSENFHPKYYYKPSHYKNFVKIIKF
ncbi:MAG: EFR1 family ferrodoxin [Oligoflexia bacterium]|nr:EFR1 family ferrodoxin [Oligoflexia bacterium]